MNKSKPDKPKLEKPAVNLDDATRMARALNAAGRTTRVAQHLPEKYRKELAQLCSPAGMCVAGVGDKVITILRNAGRDNKATGLEELE